MNARERAIVRRLVDQLRGQGTKSGHLSKRWPIATHGNCVRQAPLSDLSLPLVCSPGCLEWQQAIRDGEALLDAERLQPALLEAV